MAIRTRFSRQAGRRPTGIGALLCAVVALAVFASAAAAHPPALRLPWASGQSWNYIGGPHSTLGCPDNSFTCRGGKPWNSLDFGASGPGIVHAAAAGTVEPTNRCPPKDSNFVIINHGNGWHTTYYHLVDIQVKPGHEVKAGQPLGTTSTATGCDGHADGPHVHFSVANYTGDYSWHSGRVDLDGFQIGSWIFHDGPTQYSGCATNVVTKRRVCPGGQLSNDGALARECGATNAVRSIVATDVDCAEATQVVDKWSRQADCQPNGTTCHVLGFACRVSAANSFTDLRCESDQQLITGQLRPY